MSIQHVPCSGIYSRPPYSIQCGASGGLDEALFYPLYAAPYVLAVDQSATLSDVRMEAFGENIAEYVSELGGESATVLAADGTEYDLWVLYPTPDEPNDRLIYSNFRHATGVLTSATCAATHIVVDDEETTTVTLYTQSVELSDATFEVRDATTDAVVETWSSPNLLSDDAGYVVTPPGGATWDPDTDLVFCTSTTPSIPGPSFATGPARPLFDGALEE